MEQIGIIEAVSLKNKSVLIDGNWYYLTGNLNLDWVRKGRTEYKLNKEKEIIFLKSLENKDSKDYKRSKPYEKDSSIEQMSKVKNYVNARMSALSNATLLCIARKDIEETEINSEMVLKVAKQFLDFIENDKEIE